MNIQAKKWHLKCILKKMILRFMYTESLVIPASVTFRTGFEIYISKNGKILIGENVFFNNYCSITAMGKIEIGDDCIFGEGVKIYDHNHVFKKIPEIISTQGFKVGKVSIGKNCWIGSNVVLLKGSTIGDNCVVSAGCVIDSFIPSNSIVKRDGTIELISRKE